MPDPLCSRWILTKDYPHMNSMDETYNAKGYLE